MQTYRAQNRDETRHDRTAQERDMDRIGRQNDRGMQAGGMQTWAAGKQPTRQPDIQARIQTCRCADIPTGRQPNKNTDAGSQTDGQARRHADKQTGRWTDRHTEGGAGWSRVGEP